MNDDTADLVIVSTEDGTADEIHAILTPWPYRGVGATFHTIRRPDWPAEHWPPAVGDIVRVTIPKAQFLSRPRS